MTLKEWRELKGLRRIKLGQMVGVSHTTIGRYESGERIPEPGIAKKIFELTKGAVTPNDFHDWT